MTEEQLLSDMSEDQVLDFADACAETARRAEVDLLRAAYRWAVMHSADRLDPAGAALPGRERARRLGGPGVAEVTEFAVATLGARIGRTTYAASQLIADAQDLRHRHPELWSRVEAGEVRSSYARHVTARTRELSKEEAGHVDAAVAESADGRIPWTRFEALVEAKVAAAAPELAKRREEQARRARFAKKLHGEKHGMSSFMVRADVATIEQLDGAITALADRLAAILPDDPAPEHASSDEVPLTVDDRRVHAVRLLAAGRSNDPDADLRDLMPKVTLHLHAYAGTTTGPVTDLDTEGRPVEAVARLEGHGLVTESWISRVLGPSCRFTVRPVLDLAGQAPVDAYEIPERHRRAVHLMTPADVFPWGSAIDGPGGSLQVDHTVPYVPPDEGGPPGQSRIGNYGPMTTRHHRIKTHGGWDVHQPFPGIYVWRDPYGVHYLVDHTGTRRTRSAPPPEQAEQVRSKPIVIGGLAPTVPPRVRRLTA